MEETPEVTIPKTLKPEVTKPNMLQDGLAAW